MRWGFIRNEPETAQTNANLTNNAETSNDAKQVNKVDTVH